MSYYEQAMEAMGNKFNVVTAAHIVKDKKQKENIINKIDVEKARNIEDLDLENPNMLRMLCVHTSTGFNKNDHYFIPKELFAAKDTVMYQMVDWEHDREEVVGCIIGYATTTFDGAEFTAADIEIDENAEFDLQTEIGIWLHRKEDIANEILKRYEEDRLFVSMECTFEDFDFAIESPEGGVAIVVRNEETDFLIQHLRKFGGSGKYKNYKIGIAFRGINFIGVGIVEHPANPRSSVLDIAASEDIDVSNEDFSKILQKNIKNSENSDFVGVTDSAAASNGIKKDNKGENKMDVEKLYEKAQADLEESKANVSRLEREKEDIAKEKEELIKEKDALAEEKDQIVSEKEEVSKSVEDLTAKLESATEEKKGLEAKIEELSAKLAEIEKAKKDQDRKTQVEAYDVEIEDSELFEMTDEQFAIFLKFAPKKQEEEATEEEQTEDEAAETASEDIDNTEETEESEEEDVASEDEGEKKLKESFAKLI